MSSLYVRGEKAPAAKAAPDVAISLNGLRKALNLRQPELCRAGGWMRVSGPAISCCATSQNGFFAGAENVRLCSPFKLPFPQRHDYLSQRNLP